MKFSFPLSPRSTSPWREAILFSGLTLGLTWLFWLPGAFIPAGTLVGDVLLALGSFVPLAVAIFLDIWVQKSSLSPFQWLRTLKLGAVLLALLLPVMIFMPVLLLRYFQGTLAVARIFQDGLGIWISFIGLFILSLCEEVGWRAYLLPRLNAIPTYIVNLLIGALWFVWQLPLVLAGRNNDSENFGAFLLAMFLYAMLITPFLNRLAKRARYNPILPALMRASLGFIIVLYTLQGRADPLTDTFGVLTIGWLLVLNLVLFSQLWQGKRPSSEISELERVMPLEPS